MHVPKGSMQLRAMGIAWMLVYDHKSLAVRSRVLEFSISCQLDISSNVLEGPTKVKYNFKLKISRMWKVMMIEKL